MARVRRQRLQAERRGIAWALATVGAAIALAVACSKSGQINGPHGALHSIVIEPASATIALGGSQTFTATGKDASGNSIGGLTFFWSTSADSIATVTQSGVVSTQDTGTVQIAASVGGVSGFSDVVVSPKPVGSIVVAPTAATMRIATTLQLADTVKDGSGDVLTGVPVTWTSNNSAAVSVDDNGLVTARVLGQATITASTGGKSATSTITVAQVPVASIRISPSSPSVFVGQTTQLTAVTMDSAGDVLSGRVVRWSSANSGIATVDSVTGSVTGVRPGTVNISARSESITSSVRTTVSDAPPTTVVLSPSLSQVDAGQTLKISAQVTNSLGGLVANPTVKFTSNKPTVARVTSASGTIAQIVAGPSTGTATITGTSGAANGAATIIVSLAGVDSVHVSAPHDSLLPGSAVALTAVAYDSSGRPLTGRTVSWQSSSAAVAAVSASGTVTGKAPGVAVIFATISGVAGNFPIVVVPFPVGSVTISPRRDTLQVLGKVQLTATVKDTKGTIIHRPAAWFSTAPRVATVSSGGLVTGVSGGTAMIVDSVGGHADTNTTVVLPAIASLTVNPPTSTISLSQTEQMTATLEDASGHAVTGHAVTWQSSNHAVDTVSQKGVVYPVGIGTDTITASVTQASGPVTGQAIVTVVDPVTSLSLTPPTSTITLAPVQTQALTPTLKDSRGRVVTGPALVWKTSNPAVDTVSQQGIVYPVGVGTDTISATVTQSGPPVVGRAAVTVSDPVAAISVTPPAATITLAQTQPLTATLKDASGRVLTGRAVSWTSSNRRVDTVSSAGLVYPVGVGTDTITASVAQPGGPIRGIAVITVAVVPVASVTVAPASATITLAQTQQLTATLRGPGGQVLTGRAVVWASTNRAVDTVSQSGLVYPVGPGTDTVSATVNQPGGPVQGLAMITVAQTRVASVVVYPPAATIYATAPGNTVQLQDSTKDASGNNLPGRPVAWSPTTGGVATTDATGLVSATGTAAGMAMITATSTDGPNGHSAITVLGHAQSDTIIFGDPAHPDTLSAGATPGYHTADNAMARVMDTFNSDVTGNRTVTWTTSDSASLTINDQSSVANVQANMPVRLAAVSNVALPTTVTVTVTTTDGGTVMVSHSIQVVVIP